ncbi:MAG TPA: carbohydrate ABC transporter permease [Chloroflexota bacterium]|nr:carbohydrate ABC transporter permease [Chloroflexota bacterium]
MATDRASPGAQQVGRPETPRRSLEAERLLWRGLRIAVLLLFAVFFGLPLLWLLLATTKSNAQLLFNNPLSFGSFSQVVTSWKHLFAYNQGEVLHWAVNSLSYSGSSLILVLFCCLLAGYALSSVRCGLRKIVLTLTLVAMVMPGTALVLPIFLELAQFHLLNSGLGIILTSAFYPFGTYLAFIYFSTNLPGEMLAAARLDGCTEIGVLRYIALPLATPLAMLVAFFSFVASWNNFFLPFVLLVDDQKYTLPVGVGILLGQSDALTPGPHGGGLFHRADMALLAVLIITPVLLLFLLAQRYQRAGVFMGAEKG